MKHPLNHLILLVALSAPISINLTAQEKEPVIVERGRDHQVLRRVFEERLPDGKVRSRSSDVWQLGTGMNYWKDGEWRETKAEFQLFPEGAVARQGPFQLIIGPDAAQEGLVDVLTPDGNRLRASPRWLAYYDRATGQSEMMAAVKPCQGQLIAPNVVVFADAFDDVHAALRYTYQPWGIEQEVILLDAEPLKPGQWGLNPNGDVHLEMWSEFHEWPQPTKFTATNDEGVNDLELEFGEAQLGTGKAFPIGDEETAIPVSRTWTTVDQRQFLIEAVRQSELDPLLVKIPQQAQGAKPAAKVRKLAQRRPAQGRTGLLAQAKERERTRQRRKQTASIQPSRDPLGPGISIDYSVITTTSGLTLESAKTYYVTNTVTLSGTTTIEGGTTVKFSNLTNAISAKLSFTGPIVCLTDRYRPAVFTGKDDNTVGEIITGSSGNPGTNRYALCVFEFGSSAQSYDLQYLRISYAGKAFAPGLITSVKYTVRHVQIGNVDYPFYNNQAGTAAAIRNVLMYDTRTAFTMQSTATNWLEHITLHRCKDFRTPASTGVIKVTNALVLCVTNSSTLTWEGTNGVITNPTDTGIFTTVGAAEHYLAAGSIYRNSGVTTINPTLALDLKNRTTYPPIILTNDFTVGTILTPQAQRDTDVPDLGWSYDPLDFLISGRVLTNATLLLTNGTAVGVFGGTGLTLCSGAKFISYGFPENMNRLCPYYQVQELATNLGSSVNSLLKISPDAMATYPDIDERFTDFSMANGNPGLVAFDYAGVARLSMRDCSVLGGTMSLGPLDVTVTNTVGLTNNLVDSATWLFDQGYEGSTTKMSVHLRNNLFYRGALSLLHDDTTLGSWYVHDNLFCTNTLTTTVSHAITNSHNGYYNTAPLSSSWGNNKTLTSASFQTGFLGRFYYPTNGGAGTLTDLVNTGSRYATNAGLYHFTTATNQTKESASLVDIGFHFATVNSSGLAVDSDGDGLPDYLEDVNGNGSKEVSETGWLSASPDADTDGDGVSDYLEILLGRNPLIGPTTNDSTGILNLRRYTPLK